MLAALPYNKIDMIFSPSVIFELIYLSSIHVIIEMNGIFPLGTSPFKSAVNIGRFDSKSPPSLLQLNVVKFFFVSVSTDLLLQEQTILISFLIPLTSSFKILVCITGDVRTKDVATAPYPPCKSCDTPFSPKCRYHHCSPSC